MRKYWYHNSSEKNVNLEKKRRDTHKNEIDELKNKIFILTEAIETLKSTILVA